MAVDMVYLNRIEAEIFACFEKELMKWVNDNDYLDVVRDLKRNGMTESYIKGVIYDDLWYEFDYDSVYSECVDFVSAKYAKGIIDAIKRDEALYNKLVSAIDDEFGYDNYSNKPQTLAYFLIEIGFAHPDGAVDGWANYAIDDAYNIIVEMVA